MGGIVRMATGDDAAHAACEVEFGAEGLAGGVHCERVWFEPVDARPWIGSFRRGPGTLTTLVPLLEPWWLVVAHGAPYLVRADRPAEWFTTSIEPVVYANWITEAQILLLADSASLAAVRPPAVLWDRRVVTDELQIDEVVDGTIRCTGWEGGVGAVSRTINLHSGEVLVERSSDRRM